MNSLLHQAIDVHNGNGTGPINGRGFAHWKRTREQRIALAVDAALGRPVILTAPQAAKIAHVPVSVVVAKVKARAMAAAAIEMPTNGASVEIVAETTNDTVTTETTVSIPTVPIDTPEIRVSLRRFAAAYGCEIVQMAFAADWDPRIDRGPYFLRDMASGTNIWDGGLPVAGIADALKCLADEQQLPPERAGEAWVSFGKAWR
jgi:hypothetical protein